MSYHENSQQHSEKGSNPSSPAEIAEDHQSTNSLSIPPHIVYYCSRCHGTVEGPKYSTCTCSIPSLQTQPPAQSAHSIQHNFWKGVYDTRNMFSAAVNMFQKRKSGQFEEPQLAEPAAPSPPEEQSHELKAEAKVKVDSDDEDDADPPLSTTISSVFPQVNDTEVKEEVPDVSPLSDEISEGNSSDMVDVS